MRISNSDSTARPLFLPAVLLCALAPLSGPLHFALVRHIPCSEDGVLAHATGSSPAEEAPAAADETLRRESGSSNEHGHGHAHCPWPAHRRIDLRHADPRIDDAKVPPVTITASMDRGPRAASFALFLLAPKTSPPVT